MVEGITLLKSLQGIGTAVSVISSISEGRAASDQADFQAATTRQQAVREREIAGDEEDDFRRQQRRVLAQRRAEGGASGVDRSTGSPLLATEDFIGETELQAQRIRAGGNASAQRLNQQADLTSAAGSSAKTRGFARAGSSLLTGFSKFKPTAAKTTKTPAAKSTKQFFLTPQGGNR